MGSERDALLAAFSAEGHELWTVGGALRDELLGRPGVDEDFATDALPDETERIAQGIGRLVATVGKRFGTIGVLIDGRWSEVTSFRGDSYAAGTRWPEISLGASIAEDLARRDFTMNALARNAATGETLDLFGGRNDIEQRVIRAVGDPATRFREDPLRILRGLRFASQLDFTVDAAALEGMADTVELLATLSQERIASELEKLITGANPQRALDLLLETGALGVVLPELAPMAGCEQNHYHQFDVWGHTVATVAAVEMGERASVRRWVALLHDLGKPAVRHRKKDGEWGFYRHEAAGGDLAARLLVRLRIGRHEANEIETLIRRHMERPDVDKRASVRRFIAKSPTLWPDLIALKRADNASHTYDDTAYHDALEAACNLIAAEDAEMLRAESPLSGDDLIALFGRPAGPWIKPIKDRLSEMVFEGDLTPGDRVAAERIARELADGVTDLR